MSPGLQPGTRQARAYDEEVKAFYRAENAQAMNGHSHHAPTCYEQQAAANPYASQADATAPPTIEDIDWSEITRGVVGR